MQNISKIGKAFEVIAGELESVPLYVYPIIAVLSVLSLCCYFLVIPGCRLNDKQKVRYRRCCIYVLLLVYIGIILMITLFTREVRDDYGIQLVPLNGIRDFDHINSEILRDVCNLFLFIPVGILYTWQNKGKYKVIKSVIIALVLSLGIEFVQLTGKLGKFDVDDILFNTLGGFLGSIVQKVFEPKEDKE